MRTRRNRHHLGTTVVMVLAVCVSLTGCGQLATALRPAVDDAARTVTQAADPIELRAAASALDDALMDSPARSSLREADQLLWDQAALRKLALERLASMLDDSDSIFSTLAGDTADLVSGYLHQAPNQSFRQYLDDVSEDLLRDATCGLVAEVHKTIAENSAPELPSIPSSLETPTQPEVLDVLVRSLATTQEALDLVEEYVDLVGLSSAIVDQAGRHVERLESIVGVAEWQNSGARLMYLRHCLK